jgi:murein L,D-transpeptidase YcbB/YkuD
MQMLVFQDISKLIKLLTDSPSIIVPYLALVFSVVSIIVSFLAIWASVRNTDATIEDKNKNIILSDISILTSLFVENLSNDQWNKLQKGEPISDKHSELESNIISLLTSSVKDSEIASLVKKVREESSDQEKLKININTLRNKVEGWKND